MMIMTKKLIIYTSIIILGVLLYFAFIHNLGKQTIRLWDESRMANNAIEMYENGNFLVKQFNGNPDNWSTKPPFTVWMQTTSFKLFGISEFTFRLPSAIAGIVTGLILLLFSIRIIKNKLHGILSIMVLISILGYVGYHVTRTGDNDAILTLWTTIGALSFFSFTENKDPKYIYLGFISFALAVLTKSIAALFFVPGIFIYILISKTFKHLIINKHFYFSTLAFLSIVLGYYFLRDKISPGYINHVIENEILRFNNTDGNHKGPFLFYIIRLEKLMPYWYWTTLLTPIIFFSKHITPVIKKFALFSIIIIITYLLLISASQTKLPWYIAQVYPIWSALIALIAAALIAGKKNIVIKILVLSIFLLFFTINYQTIIHRNNAGQHSTDGREQFGYFIQKNNYINYTVVNANYSAPVFFYIKKDIIDGKKPKCIMVNKKGELTKVLPLSKSKNIIFNVGDTIIFTSQKAKKNFSIRHEIDSLSTFKKINLFKYIGKTQKDN